MLQPNKIKFLLNAKTSWVNALFISELGHFSNLIFTDDRSSITSDNLESFYSDELTAESEHALSIFKDVFSLLY